MERLAIPAPAPPEPLFEIVAHEELDGHTFFRVAPVDAENLAEILAPRITQPYFDASAARERVQRAARELSLFTGEELADDDPRLLAAIREEGDAVLPAAWKSGDGPKQLSTQRSEFAEIVAAEVLSSLFGTRIPASRITHKEIADQPTRGADVMGLEDGNPGIVLVLSEVKGSTDAKSPPGVVAGMEAKLSQLLADRRILLKELIWMRDNSGAADSAACALVCASFLLRAPQFTTLLAPILLRTSSTDADSDPGVFRSDPASFGAPVRWTSVLVDQDLFELAEQTYALARERIS